MRKSSRRLVAVILVVMIMLSVTPTTFAWKLNTHVYSGNLILEDLKDGYLTINGKNYKVPDDIYSAVIKYPKAYRAGTLGPDIYPEMATGQGVIHAENSGKHLELLMNAYTKLPLTDPNRQEIYAFILGYATHYAGDLFGHDFINEWAGGVFPSMEEMAKNSKTAEIALRHIAVEGFIDKQIFERKSSGTSNQALYNLSIDAPKEFIKDVLLVENSKVLKVQEFVKTPIDLMHDLRKYSENNKSFGGNIFEYAFKTNAAGYADRWAEDIDKALYEIVNTHEKMARDMLDPNKSTSDSISHLEDWVMDYGLSAAGSPDLVAKALGVSVDTLMDIIVGISPKEIREKISNAKKDLVYSAIESATGVSIEEVVDALKHPETLCNDAGLFKTGKDTTKLINEQIGNFAVEHNVNNMDFAPFKNTVTMGKLILLGADNLNNVFPKGSRFTKQECTENFDKIEVYIHTQYDKDTWLGTGDAGTDNDIFFFIKYRDKEGKTVEYKYLMDKPGYNDFERGDKDTYAIKLPERIGYEQIVSVGVESRETVTQDNWQPQDISIYVKGGRKIADSGSKASSGDRSFKKTFNYSGERWTAPNHILFNKKVNSGYASFDPKIISFIKSLDAGSQWVYSDHYKSNMGIWNTIFGNVTIDEIDMTPYFERLDRINTVAEKPDYNKDIEFLNVSGWAVKELTKAVNNGVYNKQILFNDCKKNITREEFATVAVNIYKAITGTRPEPASFDTFMDTEDINILIAYELGIINGKGKDPKTGKNIFSPELTLTRQEMAKIMENTIQALGIQYDSGKDAVISLEDTDQIASWAKTAARFAFKNGFIQGDGKNFNPLNNTPVEQAVIIANRFLEKYVNAYPKKTKENVYNVDLLEENLFDVTHMNTYGKDSMTATLLYQADKFILDINGKQNIGEYGGTPVENGTAPSALMAYYTQKGSYTELINIPVTSVYNAKIRFGDLKDDNGNAGFVFGVDEMKPGDQYVGYFAGIKPKFSQIIIGKSNYKWDRLSTIAIPTNIDLSKEIEFTMAVRSAQGSTLLSFYIDRQHIGNQTIAEDFTSKKSMAGLRAWMLDMNIYDFDILSIQE